MSPGLTRLLVIERRGTRGRNELRLLLAYCRVYEASFERKWGSSPPATVDRTGLADVRG